MRTRFNPVFVNLLLINALIAALLSIGVGCPGTLDPNKSGDNATGTPVGDSFGFINSAIPPNAFPVPEFGEPVTLRVISQSPVAATVDVTFTILDVDVHDSTLSVAPFADPISIGPDLAAIVRCEGTYATGESLQSRLYILGTDFEAGDTIDCIVPDPTDQCPNDPIKLMPGLCGCGVADTDSDGDGTPDCVDLCPGDANKVNPGACGCGEPDTDSDDDGTADCRDECPANPDKIVEGDCGCDAIEEDSDGDGTPDCADDCPIDPNKTEIGICGCGRPEDANNNGTPDCNEFPPPPPSDPEPVEPACDYSELCGGGSQLIEEVCLTLPPGSTVPNVDVFLLFDDTGSFASNGPAVIALFNSVVDDLQTALPAVDLAFGIGRFEDYGGPGADFGGADLDGRPFILNQAIIRANRTNFETLIADALARTGPGNGGDQAESAISEGLRQIAGGGGFDGDGNGSSNDSGLAGLPATQTSPGNSGDVPAFSTYQGVTDGSLGGVGWRENALHLAILATDVCPIATFDQTLGVPASITGLGDVAPEPVSAFACVFNLPGLFRFGYVADAKSKALSSNPAESVAPLGSALLQDTIFALNELGIRVIGLGPGAAPTNSPGPGDDESIFLSALARLTGAVDAQGNALVFDIQSGEGSAAEGIADAIVAAVTATTTLPIDVILTDDPTLPGLDVLPTPLQEGPTGPGGTACFDILLNADESFAGGFFNLNFRDAASNSILGFVPINLPCDDTQCPEQEIPR